MKNKYSADTSFLDMLFSLVLGLMILFVLSFLLITVEDKKSQNTESKAEFIITMTWDDDSATDMDLWVEDGYGNLVGFRRREQGFLHLEQDDTGKFSDTFTTEQGETFTIKKNIEHVYIRGILPTEFVINCHAWSWHEPKPMEVVIKLEKMNAFSLVHIKKMKFTHHGEEQTAFRFSVNLEGEVFNINELQKKLVTRRDGSVPMEFH